jgi:hypothetical protein
LRTNADLTIHPADKGNVTVVLNTNDYNQKVAALLGARTYRRFPKNQTEFLEQKTTRLVFLSRGHQFLRKSSSNYEHKVQGLLDCALSQRSTKKGFLLGPS